MNHIIQSQETKVQNSNIADLRLKRSTLQVSIPYDGTAMEIS